MLHACVKRFDVMSIIGNFLETKQGLNNKCYVHRILCDTIKVLLPTLTNLVVLYFFPLYAIIVEKSSIKKAPKLYFQNVAALHHIRILLINKLDFRREFYEQKNGILPQFSRQT